MDTMGNLIVFKRGRKLWLASWLRADMHEAAFRRRQITEEGYLKFSTIGAVDRRVLIGKPVQAGRDAPPRSDRTQSLSSGERRGGEAAPQLDDDAISTLVPVPERRQSLLGLSGEVRRI